MPTTPNLDITLTLQDQQLIRDFVAFANKFQNLVNQNQTKVNAIQTQGQAKTVAIQQQTQAKVAQVTQVAQAKQQQALANFYAKQQMQQLQAQSKMLKAQNSWSAKMTAGLGSIVRSIRVFGIAYATMFVGSALKGALDFAGALADIADNLNLTTQQVYGLQQALIAVGKSPDAVTTLFDKLRDLNDAQKEAFGSRGVDINNNIEMFNALLQDSALRSEILGARLVGTADALAKQGKSLDELVKKYPGTIKDLDGVARGADEIGDAFTALNFQLKEQFAAAIVAIGPQLKAFIQTLSEGLKKVDFEAVARGIIAILNGIAKFGSSGGFQVVTFFKGLADSSLTFAQTLTKIQNGLISLSTTGGVARIGKFTGFLIRSIQSIKTFGNSLLALGSRFGGILKPLGSIFSILGKIAPWVAAAFAVYDFSKALNETNNVFVSLLYAVGKFFTAITDFIGLLGSFIPGWEDFWSAPGKYLDSWILAKKELENFPLVGSGLGQEKFTVEVGSIITDPRNQSYKALQEEVKTREARVKALDAENEAIKILMSDNDLSAEGYELLKDRLKENNEELDKFFGIVKEEAKTAKELIDEMTEAWSGFSEETLRGRRSFLKLDANRAKYDATSFLPTTMSGDFLQQFRERRREIEKEISELSNFITGKGATRDPQEIKAVTDRIKLLKEELTGADSSGTSWQTYYQQAQNAAGVFFDYQAQGLNNQLEATQRLIELERQRWQNQSDALREAGLESSVYYRNQQRAFEAAEKRRLAKQESLQAKAFEQQKAANIAGTLMAGAQSFVEALPNFILAALVAALTAGQVGLIASQANPYRRAFGGLIPGSRPNSDSVPVLATGGEYIVNRRASEQNLDLLERINSGQSVTNSPTINISINGGVISREFVNTELMPLIRKGVKDGY